MYKLWKDKQSGNLVELLEVAFIPQGGGVGYKLRGYQFAERFEPVPPGSLPWRLAKVGADFLPEGFKLYCYWNGEHWNGFGCPMFTFEQARPLLGLPEMANLAYNPECDLFYEFNEEGREYFSKKGILADGRPVTVFDIGSHGWCWNEPEYVEVARG